MFDLSFVCSLVIENPSCDVSLVRGRIEKNRFDRRRSRFVSRSGWCRHLFPQSTIHSQCPELVGTDRNIQAEAFRLV